MDRHRLGSQFAARGWLAGAALSRQQWESISASSDALGRADYDRNAYRVLLTRARQGMVIFVPPGDAADATRPPTEYDAIDAWLAACGVPMLDAAAIHPD